MRLSERAALAVLVGCAAVWGSTFVVIRGALASVDPIWLVAYRFAAAYVLLLAVTGFPPSVRFRMSREGLLLGGVLAGVYVPQTLGLTSTTAADSAFITGLFVAFVPPLEWTLRGRRPQPVDAVTTALCLGGLWLLTGGVRAATAGDLLTLVCAVFCAVHIVLADRFVRRGVDVRALNAQQFLVLAGVALACNLARRAPPPRPDPAAWAAIAYLSTVATVGAFLAQLHAQRQVQPAAAAVALSLEPAFAAAFAWTLGEPFSTREALGGAGVLAALAVKALAIKSREGPRPPS